jgi:hypothetical protein
MYNHVYTYLCRRFLLLLYVVAIIIINLKTFPNTKINKTNTFKLSLKYYLHIKLIKHDPNQASKQKKKEKENAKN